jgi:hypothetical protein
MSKRLRDYGLYAVIAVTLVIALIGVAEHVHTAISITTMKWLGLAAQTPILFGYAIVDNRRFWKRLSFWTAISGLLFIHLVIFWGVLTHVEAWSPLWFVAFFPLENIAIDGTLVATGHVGAQRKQR